MQVIRCSKSTTTSEDAPRVLVRAHGARLFNLLVIDSLKLMHVFVKIADAADRHTVIELAAALARGRPGASSPPIAPR